MGDLEATDGLEGFAERVAEAPMTPGGAGGRAAALRGALESLGIVAAFLVAGLAVAAAAGPGGALPTLPMGHRALYPSAPMDEPLQPPPPRRWLVDGFNVLHAGILQGRARGGWWGSPSRALLLERVERFEDPQAELWVVFDGPHPGQEVEEGGARVVFAPSADAWLLAQVRDAADPTELAVVTADRRLGDRLRHRGARVVSPSEFLRRCGS